MRFWLLCICSARALAQAVDDDVHVPVEILAISRTGSDLAELTPLTFNAPETRIGFGDVARRDHIISGLLARQSCPSGYGLCSGGDQELVAHREVGAMEVAVVEAARGDVRTTRAVAVVLVAVQEGDVVDQANGRRGCCENGKICSGGGSSGCTSSGYSQCSGEDFCCPTGDICYRDTENRPRCRSPSSGGGGATTTTTTPPPPTTTTRTTEAPPPTTTPPTQAPPPPPPPATTTAPAAPPPPAPTTVRPTTTGVPSGTATSVVPSPTVPLGSSLVDISATDPRISYQGSWQSVDSACNSSSQSRLTTAPYSSFSLDFEGSAVYLSLAANNAWYTVTVGGQTSSFGGSENAISIVPSNCTLSFEQRNLPNRLNTMVVFINGASLGTTTMDDPWSFALEKIVVVAGGSSTTTRTGAAQSTISGILANASPSTFDIPFGYVAAIAAVILSPAFLIL
ncbi:hypothetical protein CCMSSC00406_0001139 [Pleurotus cornucopiae]|uniref:Uncharacterized protein n=1 Tax=Pleurotus cornucopiae TaxID=5321 RepID=A0ACB7IKK7_PLECO|nr:hypothetical protein CCMSSC00406_0001139 [Pleurotus cornucopiae]